MRRNYWSFHLGMYWRVERLVVVIMGLLGTESVKEPAKERV